MITPETKEVIEWLKKNLKVKVKTRSIDKDLIETKVELFLNNEIINESESSTYIKTK